MSDMYTPSPEMNTRPIGAEQAVGNVFLRSVYNWMSLGLAITAALSWYISSQDLQLFFSSGSVGFGFFIACIVAEFGLVFFLSTRIHKLSAFTATSMFLLYSALNGVTLSILVSMYQPASVAQAFITTTGMFVLTSLYGLVTKRDLSGIGSFCTMALFGLLLAMVVNWFFRSSTMELIISFAGVIVFVGLTAYDTQKIKAMGETAPQGDSVALRRGAILGALSLYLDFINLFIMLLRLLGDRR